MIERRRVTYEKARLCTEICIKIGHVRVNPEKDYFTRAELLLLYSYLNLTGDILKKRDRGPREGD